ncbi:Hypothetical protein PHPALM_15020 [Phytophthora palmivora]|uniref:Microsomal glutathione S-transferase 1 n=1 Tax=Phytophthora palmivora TaxID=4796 RepID=A0A2P4XT93_9STRA|nr:Hypothetical protein PHPALM_15020 [Phytophthora palmivora]
MTVYTTARCLHTYVYLNAMQPHRAICWGIGVLATLVGVGNAAVGHNRKSHEIRNAMVDANVKVYIACTSVLYLKFLLATGIQGGKKFRSGGRPPEDAGLSLAKTIGKGRKQTYGLDKTDDEKVLKAREAEHRWTRIVSNDLESIPFALFVFGGGILAGSNPTVHAGAMTVYTVARCLHTYVYAHAMQPHRAICWGVGVVATLVGVCNAVAAIL